MLTTTGQAQEETPYRFKGQLKSKNTGALIAYGSISVKNKPAGVASNDEGQFDFPVPAKYLNDSVVISAVGYKSYADALKNVVNKDFHTILLEDTTYSLDEVVVVNASAKEILVKVLEKLEENFPASPYEMDCFYRSTLVQDGRYAQLIEAAVRLYDRGYFYKNPVAAVDVMYNHVRKSNNYVKGAKWNEPFLTPHFIFGGNNFPRLYFKGLRDFMKQDFLEYSMETKYVNGELVHVVLADAKDSVTFLLPDTKLYVLARNHAVTRIDYTVDEAKFKYAGYNMPGYRAECEGFNATFLFREYKGRMFMHFLQVYNSASFHHQETGEFIANLVSKDEAIIQNVIALDSKKRSFRKPSGTDIPAMPYQPEFWKNYPMVHEIPVDAKMLNDLQGTIPLEAQFVANGAREKL